ncbi:MAG: EamA family transporter [Sphaerochaetaceae bacterium]|nr:EamA family transporter [Sphaerochaetaceae bacterium]
MEDKKNILSKPFFAVATALFCWTVWGTAFPLIKKCYELFSINGVASPLLFGGLRFFLAGILLLSGTAIVNRQLPIPSAENFKIVLLLGSVQTGLVYFFQYIALNYCSGTNGSIVNALQPLFMTVFAHFLFKNDRITARKIIGIVLGFSGVLVCLVGAGSVSFSFMGEGFLLISAILFSLGSNLSKIAAGKMSPVIISGWNLLIGGLELVIIGLCLGGRITNGGVLGFSHFGTLALISAVCFLLWTADCKANSVGKLAPFQFVNPITGAVLSALLLGENAFQPKNIIALVLVSLGIIITTAGKSHK